MIRQLAERAGAEGALEISDLQRIQGLVIGWQAHAVHGKVGQFQRVWAEFAEDQAVLARASLKSKRSASAT